MPPISHSERSWPSGQRTFQARDQMDIVRGVAVGLLRVPGAEIDEILGVEQVSDSRELVGRQLTMRRGEDLQAHTIDGTCSRRSLDDL